FILEERTRIQIFQLNFSKPIGWATPEWEVVREAPGCCRVRFTCCSPVLEDPLLPPEPLLGSVIEMGRDDFVLAGAAVTSPDASSVFSVQIPYCDAMQHPLPPTVRNGGSSRRGNSDIWEGGQSVANVCCRFCGHGLTHPRLGAVGRGLRVVQLPLGRWDECIDDMFCFDGPSAIPMLGKDAAADKVGQCLLGDSFVLLHEVDCVPGTILPAAAVG
ncbi:unnamed protein product, partial [Choristocarpus tenellus]